MLGSMLVHRWFVVGSLFWPGSQLGMLRVRGCFVVGPRKQSQTATTNQPLANRARAKMDTVCFRCHSTSRLAVLDVPMPLALAIIMSKFMCSERPACAIEATVHPTTASYTQVLKLLLLRRSCVSWVPTLFDSCRERRHTDPRTLASSAFL